MRRELTATVLPRMLRLALPPPRTHPQRCIRTKVDYDDNDHGAIRAGAAGLDPVDLDWSLARSCTCLLLCPAYFSWSGVAVCIFLHWLTGGIGICLTYHRLLTHRSFAFGRLARVRSDDHRRLCLGGGADRLDRRSSQAPCPLGRRRRHAHPASRLLWAHMCWWMMVDEIRALARLLQEMVSRPLQRPRSSLARAGGTSFSRSCCLRACMGRAG